MRRLLNLYVEIVSLPPLLFFKICRIAELAILHCIKIFRNSNKKVLYLKNYQFAFKFCIGCTFSKIFPCYKVNMTYYAKPNHIEYDEWFDANINPIDLLSYKDEGEFTNSVHEKFYQISAQNLTIGSSNYLF